MSSGSSEKEELELVQQLQQQLKILDDAYEPTNIPSIASLAAQVKERRQMRQRANRLELIIFWILALLVLAAGVMLFQSAPIFYLGIQAVGTGLAIGFVVIWAVRRQRKETRHE